ncbi:histone-like nucleoid-structuring protein Lsr2 [Nakamurella sp. GG22]
MVTQTQVTVVDDIDGSTDDVITCAFGLGPNQYEIDLSAENREELENVLAKFIDAARLVQGGKRARRKSSTSTRTDRQHTAEVRAWAKEQGLQVSERGRIGKEVLDAYRDAH